MIRRELLAVAANPAPRLDYLVALVGDLAGELGEVRLTVRYVPDRLILAPPAFVAYLAALGGAEWPSLEALAAAVLDDLNNELVARWVQVAAEAEAAAGLRHVVVLEDRQPRWDNRVLLERLPAP